MGFPFLFLGTLGNSVYLDRQRDKWLGTAVCFVAIASTALYVFVPAFYDADFGFFSTNENEINHQGNNERFLKPIAFILGSLLLVVQFTQLMRLHISETFYFRICCRRCARPSTVRKAREMKKAANL